MAAGRIGRLGAASAGLARAAVFVVLLGLGARPSNAHIVVEEPWNPAAAGYQTMIFLANLQPVPWQQVEQAFVTHLPVALGTRSARESLAEIGPGGDAGAIEAVLAAIAQQDRQALYESATRALSSAIRHQLQLAARSLAEPAVAVRHIETARSLYRAFEKFIQQADPDAYRVLGRAWLGLNSSLGSAGIVGKGGVAADNSAFQVARDTIVAYMQANYEPAAFEERDKLAPVPESIIQSGTDFQITPWLPPGTNFNDQNPLPRLVLNFEEQGIDEKDLLLVAYGDMLFDSPRIFGLPARANRLSCSICHNRSDINNSFFIPGISHQAGAVDVDGEFFNAMFNDRRADSIDIPSLRGLRFTAPYGRDGREASLRDFTRNVIVNEFGGPEPTPFMLDALVAYMTEFDLLPNSKVNGDGILGAGASQAERRGETLFRKPFEQMDGKSCASCHIPSSNFLDRRSHDIGSRAGNYEHGRDGAFDTPTLLGARFTAPYFHDGSLPSLASVVDWFDSRFALALSDGERADLTAYVEAIGDADEPFEIYEGRNTPFALAFGELTTFASTLDTLLPARDAFHAKLMIETVAPDLVADAAGMSNTTRKGVVYEMAELLAGIGESIDRADWKKAQELWAEFKELEQEHAAQMY